MNTREEWLNAALTIVRAHIRDSAGVMVPDNSRVSCGFPGGASRKAIGQCWSTLNSADGSVEMFISPVVSDSASVLAILVHEAVHAAVGVQHGHKAPFKRVALASGLTGKMTATVAGDSLRGTISIWVATLGAYPHATLSMSDRKKQTTRMIKASCVCGYTVRLTRKWADCGAPYCGVCVDEDTDMPLQMTIAVEETEEGEE